MTMSIDEEAKALKRRIGSIRKKGVSFRSSSWFICIGVIECSFVIALLVASPVLLSAQGQEVQSIYSNLSGNDCKHLTEDRETGAAKDECAGVDGFRLLILNDDSRSSVTVVTPEKKEFPLEYWNVVTHAFSTLGRKAEWRVIRGRSSMRPIALIVRVEYLDQSNLVAPKRKSVLTVAKITPEKICVVENVKGGADDNARARMVADNAASKVCLEAQP